MKVLVTGGGGFLGRLLAGRLLERGALTGPSGRAEAIDSLVLLDVAHPPMGPDLAGGADPGGGRVRLVTGDVTDGTLVRSLVDGETSVFHLASMVSAGCEADFDGALRVNLDGGRAVMEACRATGAAPRLVFSSSIAAYGGDAVAGVVSDTSRLTPETTYGTTKVICELLVNDYTRKGFLDGRSARLPTVAIRPGRPNAAATSWVSGLFREPLAGEECVVPVEPSTRLPISGYRTVVDNLIRLHEVDGAALGNDRGLNLPALAVSVHEMLAGLRAAADRPLGPVVARPDPAVTRMFSTWASRSSFDRALALGMLADPDVESIVRAYIEDFLGPPRAS